LDVTDVPQGTIEINSHFNFAQPAFRGRKTIISIDGGEPQACDWGDTSHVVEAGEHTVHVEVAYALNKKVGKATATVNVGAGETVRLSYRPPALVTMAGKLKLLG
jgi:hypothetical protein